MTIFQKIIDGEIPAHKYYEDDDVLVFKDIAPQGPFHAVAIPKKPISDISRANAGDAELLGKLLLAAATVARENGIEEEGYRVVSNIGEHGGQTVPHLHIHLIGGRQLGWPPG